MPPTPDRSHSERFQPHASRTIGGMFDDVSGRYDLLNTLMSLGQDRAWRAALARAVPEGAGRVLDLCTGSGASLHGLRRPGRLVLGMDVSARMLELAAGRQVRSGWAPRLVCADAFRLPLRDGALDAVTLAFGMRNLRPRPGALAELARALAPGGTLAVLEAAAPGAGPFAPFHRFYLRHVVPLLGRLSPDPSAYAYLSRSVFEFGSGPEFELELEAAGFQLERRRSFLLGATRLWAARRTGGLGQNPTGRVDGMHSANPPEGHGSGSTTAAESEWRCWVGAQLLVSAVLTVALGIGLGVFLNSRSDLSLTPWQDSLAWLLLGGGLVAFAVRTVVLLVRFLGPPARP